MLLFYTLATEFQLYLGRDMMYELAISHTHDSRSGDSDTAPRRNNSDNRKEGRWVTVTRTERRGVGDSNENRKKGIG